MQKLISHNHAKNDVLDMAYGEFVAYLSVIQDDEVQNLKQMAMAVRVANADSKAFEKWLKDFK